MRLSWSATLFAPEGAVFIRRIRKAPEAGKLPACILR
jgi:hypothetical protein